MHPLIQQRREVLAAMLTRSQSARSAFYSRIDQVMPAMRIRYQVITKGPSAYHIIEVATGKVRGFRFAYKAAVEYAIQLEAKANRSHPAPRALQ